MIKFFSWSCGTGFFSDNYKNGECVIHSDGSGGAGKRPLSSKVLEEPYEICEALVKDPKMSNNLKEIAKCYLDHNKPKPKLFVFKDLYNTQLVCNGIKVCNTKMPDFYFFYDKDKGEFYMVSKNSGNSEKLPAHSLVTYYNSDSKNWFTQE